MTEKTAVHTPTKEEYDRLMKAYEKKGWVRSIPELGYDKDFPYVIFGDNYLCYAKSYNFTIITVDEAIAKLGLYERGQEVMVRDSIKEQRYKRIYVGNIEGATHPYIVVEDGAEGKFNNGDKFRIQGYAHIKPLEPTTLELTMKDIEDKYGCKVKIVK